MGYKCVIVHGPFASSSLLTGINVILSLGLSLSCGIPGFDL